MGAPAQGLLSAEQVETLVGLLFEARSWGFLGPGPVEPHITHALGFAEAVGQPPTRLIDVGSGGGVPGLVLAELWAGTNVVLLDANERRTDFLIRAAAKLSRSDPPQIVRARAEDAGRDPALRSTFDVAVARSFGPPAVTAECVSPFVMAGGRMVVSEPPGSVERWPADGLRPLGLTPIGPLEIDGGRYQILSQASPCPDKYPRRVGKPAKRPLF